MNKNRARRIGAIGAAAVLVPAVVGTGFAASASAAAPASTEKVVTSWSGTLAPLASTPLPDMLCPADAPYLINQDYSPGRIVPRGVEVVEKYFGAGVTIPKAVVDNDVNRMASGSSWYLAGATNWQLFASNKIEIKLHCTSDHTRGYWVPYDSSPLG